MNIAFFSSQPYDRQFFTAHNKSHNFGLQFFDVALSLQTASLAKGVDAVCVFVNDKVDAAVIEKLKEQDVKIIALVFLYEPKIYKIRMVNAKKTGRL